METLVKSMLIDDSTVPVQYSTRMSDSLNKTAEELACIMAEHLATLSPDERKARIKAGDEVLKKAMKRAKASPGPAGIGRTVASIGQIFRSPLAARGR